MARLFAKLICISIAYAAGLTVFREVGTVFKEWVPMAAGGISFVIVFCVLYFPLARPIADSIGDKMAASMHRGRHVRSGSGLEEIPDAPKQPKCSICGAAQGPICPLCNIKMSEDKKNRISLKP